MVCPRAARGSLEHGYAAQDDPSRRRVGAHDGRKRAGLGTGAEPRRPAEGELSGAGCAVVAVDTPVNFLHRVTTMLIADAQRDVRSTFLGGSVGQLVSAVLWAASAALATWGRPRQA